MFTSWMSVPGKINAHRSVHRRHKTLSQQLCFTIQYMLQALFCSVWILFFGVQYSYELCSLSISQHNILKEIYQYGILFEGCVWAKRHTFEMLLCVHYVYISVCVCVCVCGCACACACTCIFTWTQPRLCCLILLSPYCFSFSMNKIIVEKKVIDRQTDRRPDGQTGGQPACPAETAYLGVFPEQVFLACHCWLGSSANKPTHSSLCKEDWSRPELSKVHVCVCVCVCVCKCVCVYVCAQSDWCLLWLVITEIMERN